MEVTAAGNRSGSLHATCAGNLHRKHLSARTTPLIGVTRNSLTLNPPFFTACTSTDGTFGVYGLLGSQSFSLSLFLVVALKSLFALALDVNSYRVKIKIKKREK